MLLGLLELLGWLGLLELLRLLRIIIRVIRVISVGTLFSSVFVFAGFCHLLRPPHLQRRAHSLTWVVHT